MDDESKWRAEIAPRFELIDNAPEGREYYERCVPDRHAFKPTGRFDAAYEDRP